MMNLTEECIQLLNNGVFEIVDPGPLHHPIRRFSIRRDEKLELILETEAEPDAKSNCLDEQSGLVRVNTDRTLLRSIGDAEAEFIGVSPRQVTRQIVGAVTQPITQIAKINIARTLDPAGAPIAHVIDWVENLPASPYQWPDTSEVITRIVTTHRISVDDGIRITSDRELGSSSVNSAKFILDGVAIYVSALDSKERPGSIKPGCIIYDGAPDDRFRKKVRLALSFALGRYLVEMGTTSYDSSWKIVSAYARSAYSLGQQAYNIPTLQFAPLGKQFLYELNPTDLTRAVRAFFKEFDTLDLANLHWAFWHACIAPPHIAPAHFGSAIEGLQKAYIKANWAKGRECYITSKDWKALQKELSATLDKAKIPEDAKNSLRKSLFKIPKKDQRELLSEIMTELDLQMSNTEYEAWGRRNKSAHGVSIPEGQEVEAINDVKLLRGLFQRLLLRITNAADQYIDYTSRGHKYRFLHEPPV